MKGINLRTKIILETQMTLSLNLNSLFYRHQCCNSLVLLPLLIMLCMFIGVPGDNYVWTSFNAS